MGLFFEVIIVSVALWWLCRAALRRWRARRAARSGASAAAPGAHDAGVWVNEVRWAQIVAKLESELEGDDHGGKPPRRRPE